MQYIKAEKLTQKMQVLCGLQVLFLLFNCQTPEDANTTLDKQAAENLNIIRKWCISILKMVEIFRPNLSMKKKRFVISMNPEEFLEQVLNF